MLSESRANYRPQFAGPMEPRAWVEGPSLGSSGLAFRRKYLGIGLIDV
jgi:hypothetical protein